MTNITENTMQELEEILNDLEPDASRLRDFLNNKAARKARGNQQFLLAVPDMTFDIGVDLVKLPAQKELKLKQNDPVQRNIVADSQPQPENERTLALPVRRSFSVSPSMARKAYGASPFKRCTRRTELKNMEMDKTPSPISFMPAISSTPAVEIQPSQNKSQKSATPKCAEKKNEASAKTPLTIDDFENSYLGYLMNTKGIGQLPLSLPNKSRQQSESVNKGSRRTSDLKNRTEGDEENTMHGSQLKVRLKRVSLIHNEDLPESAVQLDKCPDTEQQTEVDIAVDRIVPASVNSSPASLRKSPFVSQPPLPKEIQKPKSPAATLPPTQAISSPKPPPLANVSCGIQTSCSLPVNPQQKEVVESVVPIKLKPTGAGKTTKHQLQTQTDRESSSDNDELVLDLHKSRRIKKNIALDKARTKSVLNKPSHPEINGEQFAKELAKMSNYEIIDLRKRNSLGMLKGQLSKEQHVVEQQIQQEISRRKLENNESIIHRTIAQKSSQERVSPLPNLKRRTNRQQLKMTKELKDYMLLSQTIETRLKKPTVSNGKRNLYTKGDSICSDDNISSPSPKKKAKLSDEGMQVISSPPSASPFIDALPIASPPPVSMRFSQQSLIRGKSNLISGKDAVEPPDRYLSQPPATSCTDTVAIVPPPPVSLRFSQQIANRRKSICTADSDDLVQPAASLSPTETVAEKPVQPGLTEVQANSEEEDNQSMSENMESLRQESITPPTIETILFDDQPSTSRAAREALANSVTKKTNTDKKKIKEKTSNDNVFKKPLPKQKTRTAKKNLELKRLQISEALSQDDFIDSNNATIRKSKRGQIPLRNDFCHTLNDPFSFMRKTYGVLADSDGKTSKRKRNGQQKKQPTKKPPVAQLAESETQQKKRKRRELAASPEELVPVEEPELLQDPLCEIPAEEHEEPQPQQDISPVFSWLRGVSNTPPKSVIQQDIKFKSVFASSAANLNFTSLENIDYAFYETRETCSLGYMRLQPLQQRGFKRNKTNNLQFIVIYGKFCIEIATEKSKKEGFVLNTGDMVDIKVGCRFNIINSLNEVGLLLVNRTSVDLSS